MLETLGFDKEWSKLWFSFILQNRGKGLSWYGISQNPNITWDIIQENPDIEWDWRRLSRNMNITW